MMPGTVSAGEEDDLDSGDGDDSPMETFPDLFIESISWEPENPKPGDTVTITAIVKNQGTGESEDADLAYHIDGIGIGEREIPELDPGSSTEISETWTPSKEGTVNLLVWADTKNDVYESNEWNNVKTESIEVIEVKKETYPDLIVESISWEPANPEPGDTVTITTIVKNQGTERSIKTDLAYYIDESWIGEREIPALDPGSSSQILETWTPGNEGTVNIRAQADAGDYVYESDEWNNEKTESIEVIEVTKETYPDLMVEAISCNPTEPEPGQKATVTVTVKNQGTGESGPTNLVFYIDGIYTAESEIPDLNYYDEGNYVGTYAEEGDVPELTPESSSSISFEWTPETEGTAEITAVVDSNDVIIESDEENNEKTEYITAKKKKFPDLTIWALSAEPDNLELGSTVNIAVTVRNRGNEKSGNTNLAFYVNEEYIGEAQLPELAAKSSIHTSYQWVPETEGSKQIRVKVDEDNLVIESNEWNNWGSDNVVVEKQKAPDLVIEKLTAEPATPEPGDIVTITATVKNQGTEKSEGTDLAYYIDGAGTRERTIPGIEPGSSSQISFAWIPSTAGTVNIWARADAGDNVPESDEGNNENTISIEVTKHKSPDLVIEALPAEPVNPEPGETITITAIVKNQGTEKSEETDLAYYIDGTRTGEGIIPGIEPGSSSQISFAWTTDTEGTVNIRAWADAGDNVPESDEGNNENTISIEVTKHKSPDLLVEALTTEPSNPEPGDAATIMAAVKNQGTEKSEETNLTYYIGGTEAGEKTIPGLEPGSSLQISFAWTPDVEGTVNIRAHADSEDKVPESDEGNNEKTISIEVTTQKFPDLLIDSLTWTPQKPNPGESVAFTVTVKNTGTAGSEENVLEYKIGEENEGNLTVTALSVGETSGGTFSWAAGDEGQIEVKAVVDSGNTVPESSETNNEITRTVTVSKETSAPSGGGGGGSSSSSSSSSSGGSKEPARNVEIKELSTRHIINGYHARYEFPENVTCVTLIEFDPRRTFKKTTTIVEVLKEKSIFASKIPPGRLYKNLNIWVGDKGAGNPGFLENAYIEFRVEKSWIEQNGINESLVTLLRYDKGWNPLKTEKKGEDGQYVYFKARTPGFSPFAISEYTGEEEETIEDPEEELKGVPSSLGEFGEDGVVNGSAEREEDGEEKKPIGKAKVLMAISLPIFMILVQFLVLKKRG